MINRQAVVQTMQSGNIITEQINGALTVFGLSIQQFNVLRILRGRNGHVANLESITSDMIHRMSNTSRLVDRLVEKDLCKRVVCEQNRRKVDISITESGLKLLQHIDPVIEQKEAELTENLTESEVRQLVHLLTKMKSKN